VTTVLYLIAGVVLTAALAYAWWRCFTLRRALRGERAMSRLGEYAWALDAAAAANRERARLLVACREEAVIAEANAVLDALLPASGSDLPRGGHDG
jgi:hypothetical protein